MIIILVRVSEHDENASMISDLSLAIKLHKNSSGSVDTVVVEYATPEEAEQLSGKSIVISGESVTVESSKGYTGKKKPSSNFKKKVYLGNISEHFDSEKVKQETHSAGIKLLSVFVSPGDKKYGFLEFEKESDRNAALGLLEKMKRDGALENDLIVSPAYPYAQKTHSSPRK